jgi:hypothetical protein
MDMEEITQFFNNPQNINDKNLLSQISFSLKYHRLDIVSPSIARQGAYDTVIYNSNLYLGLSLLKHVHYGIVVDIESAVQDKMNVF